MHPATNRFLLLLVLAGLITLVTTAAGLTISTICAAPGGQTNPAIDGDHVAWDDGRYDSYHDIYLYDIATNKEIEICKQRYFQDSPKISGNRIVWADYRNFNDFDIYLYDLTTGTENRITTDSANQQSPDISGDRVVWMDDRNGKAIRDIYLYDLPTGMETAICNASGDQVSPAISGNFVVWQDHRNGGYPDIHLYDLTTKTETVIGTGYQPAISGNFVVWIGFAVEGGKCIYLYDIGTGTETVISGATPQKNNVAIDGNRVVWEDDRDGYTLFHIFMYNLVTGSESPIISDQTQQQQNPAISGNRIVFKQNDDIYMADLSKTPPVADAGLDQTVLVGVDVSFDGSGSSDPDGTIDSYSWEFGDGSSGTGATVTHAYIAAGTYSAILRVTDNDDLLDDDTAVITVQALPVAEAGPDQTVLVGVDVSFDGSGSSDPDGTIDSYSWEFGDGSSGTGATVTHAYTIPGIYTATLSVTDDDSYTGSDSATVTVKTPAEATEDLFTQVEDLGLPTGTEQALTAKLDAATEALDKGKEKTAINNLKLFISQVEALRGKKLDTADADALIAEAQKIIAAI